MIETFLIQYLNDNAMQVCGLHLYKGKQLEVTEAQIAEIKKACGSASVLIIRKPQQRRPEPKHEEKIAAPKSAIKRGGYQQIKKGMRE